MRVLLDTCILFPHLTRGLLLGVCDLGHFDPCWSEQILAEWRATGRKHSAEAEANISIALANSAYPNALISDVAVRDDLVLPDMDDTHVLAAALSGNADAIMTVNIRDFPSKTLARYGLLRLEPDPFLLTALAQDRTGVMDILSREIAKIPDGPKNDVEIKAILKKARLSRFAKAL